MEIMRTVRIVSKSVFYSALFVAGYSSGVPRKSEAAIEPSMSQILREEVMRLNEPRVTYQVAFGVFDQESSKGKQLSRFEKHKFVETGDPTTHLERVAMATSHGPMHVLGTTLKSLKYDWKAVQASPRLGIRAGLQYLAICLRGEESLFDGLRCYNGGEGWKSSPPERRAQTESYARTVTTKIAEFGYQEATSGIREAEEEAKRALSLNDEPGAGGGSKKGRKVKG